jgi:hypothetical protein
MGLQETQEGKQIKEPMGLMMSVQVHGWMA